MQFTTVRRLILALDILMIVTAAIAVLYGSVIFWVVTALMVIARMWLYLKAGFCPHCRKPVRPDRAVYRCPHCGRRLDGVMEDDAQE